MTLVNEETGALSRQDIHTQSLEVSKHSLVATFPFRDGRPNSGDGSWDTSYLKNKDSALTGLYSASCKQESKCMPFIQVMLYFCDFLLIKFSSN